MSSPMNVPMRVARIELLSNASAAGLRDAVNGFLRSAGNAAGAERVLLDIQYGFDGATYTAMIVYTE